MSKVIPCCRVSSKVNSWLHATLPSTFLSSLLSPPGPSKESQRCCWLLLLLLVRTAQAQLVLSSPGQNTLLVCILLPTESTWKVRCQHQVNKSYMIPGCVIRPLMEYFLPMIKCYCCHYQAVGLYLSIYDRPRYSEGLRTTSRGDLPIQCQIYQLSRLFSFSP